MSTGAQQLTLVLAPEAYAAERHCWKAKAARLHFGACAHCGRARNDDRRPLLVARQERCRRFLCFDCWRRTRTPLSTARGG